MLRFKWIGSSTSVQFSFLCNYISLNLYLREYNPKGCKTISSHTSLNLTLREYNLRDVEWLNSTKKRFNHTNPNLTIREYYLRGSRMISSAINGLVIPASTYLRLHWGITIQEGTFYDPRFVSVLMTHGKTTFFSWAQIWDQPALILCLDHLINYALAIVTHNNIG